MAIPFLPRRDEDDEEAGPGPGHDVTSAEASQAPPPGVEDVDQAPPPGVEDVDQAPPGVEDVDQAPPGVDHELFTTSFAFGTDAGASAESASAAVTLPAPAGERGDEPSRVPEPVEEPTSQPVDKSPSPGDVAAVAAPRAEPPPERPEEVPSTVPPVSNEPGPGPATMVTEPPVVAEPEVHDVASAPAPSSDGAPPLGADHLAGLLGQRERDVLRPGGGQQVARPARVIAMANQKGGVGKTTTTINLGAALAELGSRVLLVDIDPQGSLGVGLGADPHAREQTVYNLLLVDGTSVDDVLIETKVENLHLLPANIDLAAAELLLVQEVAREQALRRVIERVQYRYDFVLIDCPPSLGLLTINGLTAAETVIVPLEAEYFALRGMSLLMQTLEKVQARLNPRLKLEGIVATMFDGRTLHAREVLERVRAAFGDTVFKTTINKTIRFAEAPVAGEPILTYRPRSKGSDAYRDLAREVLAREPSS